MEPSLALHDNSKVASYGYDVYTPNSGKMVVPSSLFSPLNQPNYAKPSPVSTSGTPASSVANFTPASRLDSTVDYSELTSPTVQNSIRAEAVSALKQQEEQGQKQ